MSRSKSDREADSALRPPEPSIDPLSRIGGALRDLRYGTITIHVQDSRVVQIDRTEKVRLR